MNFAQVLKTDKDKEEAKHEEERQELIERQHQELQDLESANNQKLMAEYEKYQELQVMTNSFGWLKYVQGPGTINRYMPGIAVFALG